jgi:hypothetical protein
MLVGAAVLTMSPVLLGAQAASATATVRGVAFDSLQHRPLANASVQLVGREPGAPSYAGTTDSLGRFEIAGVLPGRLIAGMQAPILDTLGISAPYREIIVTGGEAPPLTLAIPSGGPLIRAICASSNQPPVSSWAADSGGMLVGLIRDAITGAPVPQTEVEMTWSVLLGAPSLRTEMRALRSTTNAGGWFAMCGVGVGEYEVRAVKGERQTGFVDVKVMPHDISRLSLALGTDSSGAWRSTAVGVEGSAQLSGIVTAKDGRAIEGVHVSVDGAASTSITDDHGRFSLANLPDGTRTAEFRAIGYEVTRVVVEPRRDDPAKVVVQMPKLAHRLDVTTVLGRSGDRKQRFMGDLYKRRQRGAGRFLTATDIGNAHATSLCDLLQRAGGLTTTYGPHGCEDAALGGCHMSVYENGYLIQPEDIADVDKNVRVDNLSGVEIYSRSAVPIEYSNGCGAVILW